MTVYYIAALLITYKAIIYWAKRQAAALEDHHDKLRQSFEENEGASPERSLPHSGHHAENDC